MADYTDLTTLKSYLGISVSGGDSLVQMAITSASRAVDAWCQRRFWLDPTAVARTFEPLTPAGRTSLTELTLPVGAEIGAASGITVAVDPSGRGVFDQVWAGTDFELLPVGAPFAVPEAKPWTGFRAVGGHTLPWLVNTWLTRYDRVQVTARWGWPEIPAAVVQATLIKAGRLYHRKDSPQGIAGFNDWGPVRLTAREDGDVMSLLASYRAQGVLVA